jgi:hypothetical protein
MIKRKDHNFYLFVFWASFKLLEFQNMNNGLHMKELVLCVELARCISKVHQQQR